MIHKPEEDKAKAAAKAEEQRTKLPAEQKFDKAVYGGISYFAQAATGIALSYWMAYSGGRKYFDKIGKWAGPAIFEKITSKRGNAAVEEATSSIIVTTMVMVGNAFILPVKWLENRKSAIVRGMTERDNARREACGDHISPEEHTAQEKALHDLENAPKQTWGSLFGGRAFALGAVYTALFAIGNARNQAMEKFTSGAIRDAMRSTGAKQAAGSEVVDGTLRIAFNDFFYSAISASGLYIYSHFINPPHKAKKGAAAEELSVPPLEEGALAALGLGDEFHGQSTDPIKRLSAHAPDTADATWREHAKRKQTHVQPKPASHAESVVRSADNSGMEAHP